MNFVETLEAVEKVVDLIDAYDEPAKKTIEVLIPFLPQNCRPILQFILNYEPRLVSFMLAIVRQCEKLLGAGSGKEKFAEAEKTAKCLPKAMFPGKNLPELINQIVGAVNSIVKPNKK